MRQLRFDPNVKLLAKSLFVGVLYLGGCHLIGGAGDYEVLSFDVDSDACLSDEQCAEAQDASAVGVCERPACIDGRCGLGPKAEGDACSDPNNDEAVMCDGLGACVACVKNGECPSEGLSDCERYLCTEEGTCERLNQPEGTECTSPVNKTGSQCNSMGACVICNTAEDCATKIDPPELCYQLACKEEQACGTEPAPAKTECNSPLGGKGLCNGLGECGQCVEDSDCQDATPGAVCVSFQCVDVACNDTVQNGTETDVDCGGGCPPCNLSKSCNNASDCQSAICTNGTCVSCVDANCGEADYCANVFGDDSGACKPKKPVFQACVDDKQCIHSCVIGFCTLF